MMNVKIDTIYDGKIFLNNAVVNRETFSGDFDALLDGETVACGWDDNDEPIEWAVLSED